MDTFEIYNNAVSRLEKLSSSSCGPHGCHFILQSSCDGGNVLVTKSATRFFKEFNPSIGNILLKAMLDMLSSQSSVYGDGGWFCSYFCSKLIRNGVVSQIPLSILISGYLLATSIASNLLNETNSTIKIPFRWSDANIITKLVRSIISTKTSLSLNSTQIDNITSILISAFINSLLNNSNTSSLSPNLYYRHLVGLPPDLTNVLNNTIVMDIPIPIALQQHQSKILHDVFIILFDCSLELSEFPSNLTFEFELNTTGKNDSIKDVEFLLLEKFAKIVVDNNIKVVCSQKRIHPYLQRILAEKGVVCIPRLSIRFIHAFQELSGALLLSALPSLSSMASTTTTAIDNSTVKNNNIISLETLGFLSSISIQKIGTRKYVMATLDPEVDNNNLLRSSRRKFFSTMLLAMSSPNLCDELQATCEGVMNVLMKSIDMPYVLPGSGCWQAYLSHGINKKLAELMEKKQKGEEDWHSIIKSALIFSQTLKEVAYTIACGSKRNYQASFPSNDITFQEGFTFSNYEDSNCVADQSHKANTSRQGIFLQCPNGTEFDIITQTNQPINSYHSHSNPRSHHCDSNDIDINEEDGSNNTVRSVVVLKGEIFDSFAAYSHALQLAVDVAITMMEIDGIAS